jgi:cathepsin C
MGMLESRLRVQTNNTLRVQLSPQDVVSCSQLSQGCAGGFPFLVAGKYAKVGTSYTVQKNIICLQHWCSEI